MAKTTAQIIKIKHKDKLVLGIILIILTCCLKFGSKSLINLIIKSQLKFREGSYHYKMWQTNEIPYQADFYFFNWTNPEQISEKNVKPRFVEVGPYHFDMFINRTNIKIHEENSSVTYEFNKRFISVKDKKSRSLEDVITTLNPIANTIAYQARKWNPFLKYIASLALRASKANLFIRKTVAELIFEGYEDTLLSINKNFPMLTKAGLGMQFPDKFGFFYKRNYTDFNFGPYNVYVGVDENYGELQTIKGSTHTEFFPGKCGKAQGKLGEYISPYQDPKKELKVYIHDLNTYASCFYSGERNIDGIIGSLYMPKDYIFDNGTRDKSNECFCNGECVPSGMLNSSSSFMQAPLFMSMPHFQLADGIFQESVEIIRSHNKSIMPYLIVDSDTGILLEGALTIQVNFLLQPIKNLGLFSNVPRVFMPILIFQQSIKPKGGYIYLVKILQKLPLIINCICIILLMGSFFLLLLCIKTNNTECLRLQYMPVKRVT